MLRVIFFCFIFLSQFVLAEESVENKCLSTTREQIAKPSIDLITVENYGRQAVPKLKVKGTFEGVCLKEAAIFEDGKKVRTLTSLIKDKFHRFGFSAFVNPLKSPEIRVYTVHGDRVTANIASNKVYSDQLDLNFGENPNVEVIVVPPVIEIPYDYNPYPTPTRAPTPILRPRPTSINKPVPVLPLRPAPKQNQTTNVTGSNQLNLEK